MRENGRGMAEGEREQLEQVTLSFSLFISGILVICNWIHFFVIFFAWCDIWERMET